MCTIEWDVLTAASLVEAGTKSAQQQAMRQEPVGAWIILVAELRPSAPPAASWCWVHRRRPHAHLPLIVSPVWALGLSAAPPAGLEVT
ncbi:unnamed protein product [Arctogadus glacialis]